MVLYRMSEWQTFSGHWCCADVDQLSNKNNNCWTPCRVWGLSPAAFFKMLIVEYHADIFHNEDYSFVDFWFKSQSDMRLFKNRTNKLARDKHFYL